MHELLHVSSWRAHIVDANLHLHCACGIHSPPVVPQAGALAHLPVPLRKGHERDHAFEIAVEAVLAVCHSRLKARTAVV